MPTQQLTGTKDEQLAFVYNLVQERMAEGKYTGAIHYAQEIIKYDPNYRDIQAILEQARQGKSHQTNTLLGSLLAAILAVVLVRSLGWTSDWISLAAAVIGGLLGYFVTSILILRRFKR